MHKEIERAISRITQAMEKNRNAYEEAKGSYRDTGYDLYWNKMQKLDAEYDELEAFIHQKEEVSVAPETIRKLDELQRKVKNIKSKWDYLRVDLPTSADSVGIDELFKDIKGLLN